MGTSNSKAAKKKLAYPSTPPKSVINDKITVFSTFKNPTNNCIIPAEVLQLIFSYTASSCNSLSKLEQSCQQFYKLLNNPTNATLDIWRLHNLCQKRILIIAQEDEQGDLQTLTSSSSTLEWKKVAKRHAEFLKDIATHSYDNFNVALCSSSKSIDALSMFYKFLRTNRTTEEESDTIKIYLKRGLSGHPVSFSIFCLSPNEETSRNQNDQLLRGDMLLMFHAVGNRESEVKAAELFDRYCRMRDDDYYATNAYIIGITSQTRTSLQEGQDEQKYFYGNLMPTLVGVDDDTTMNALIVEAFKQGHKVIELRKQRGRRRPRAAG